MQYSNQNTGFDGWRDNAAANLAEKIAAETALVEARREWANDTEALNALRAELAEAKAYRLRETRRADNNLDEYNKLEAAIGRVRELHYHVADKEDGDWCHGCNDDWPCPTVRAMLDPASE